jgi:hypothetical protein
MRGEPGIDAGSPKRRHSMTTSGGSPHSLVAFARRGLRTWTLLLVLGLSRNLWAQAPLAGETALGAPGCDQREYLYLGDQLIAIEPASSSGVSVSLASPGAAFPETGNATAMVILSSPSGPLGCEVRVDFATLDGTATGGIDYIANTGFATFSPGSGHGTSRPILVELRPETTHEPDETFVVRLSSPAGATLGAITDFTATIANDDAAPTISIADLTAEERNAGWDLSATVALSNPSYQAVTLDWATANGTATAPGDFSAATGSATFPPDATTASLTVPIVADSSYEGDEHFFVNLSNPSNATIADGSARVTLREDDPPSVSVSDAHVLEGDDGQTKAAFQVSLQGPSHLPISVGYHSVDCTAFSRADYQTVSGKLEVPAESAAGASIDVMVNANLDAEPLKVFELELYDPSNAVLGDARGSGSILNDDGSLGLPARADFDGDGEGDLLFADRTTGNVEVWPMNGDARRGAALALQPPRPVNGNWGVAGVADFDHDNRVDILWRNRDSGNLAIWLMNGVVRVGAVLLDGIPELKWHLVATADVDRDGSSDLVWWNEGNGESLVWFLDGTTFRSARRPSPPAPQEGAAWQLQAVADLTGDDHADWIWRNLASGAVVYWQMAGLVRTTGDFVTPSPIDRAWTLVSSFDIDPDRQPDLLAQHAATGDVVVFHMNGVRQYCGSAIAPRPGATLQLVGPR